MRLPSLSIIIFLAMACAGCKRKEPAAPPTAASIPAESTPVVLLPERYTTEGKFLGDVDLSGLASLDGKTGIIVNDETRSAQAITIDATKHVLTAGAEIPLLGPGSKTEADLEGAAANPAARCYYVTGSHGVSKKKGEFQQDRCHVFRIPANPVTGAPLTSGIQTASLWPWLARSAEFGKFIRLPLQSRGFNLEGLAFRDGKLYFGVRGPNLEGQTFVIETDAEKLFSGVNPECTLHKLTVGASTGIRELVALQRGFLVLLGNAGSEPSKQQPRAIDYDEIRPYTLFWWEPGDAAPPRKIGILPNVETSAKAEGLLVLAESDSEVKVLVVFDGVPNGGPKVYKVPL